MILVTGATGNLGGAAVRQLLARTDASQIAVLVRDPQKAAGLAEKGVSVRAGDYDDPNSLAAALDGVDRVLLVASNQFQQREAQHRDVLDAVRPSAGRRYSRRASDCRPDREGSRSPSGVRWVKRRPTRCSTTPERIGPTFSPPRHKL